MAVHPAAWTYEGARLITDLLPGLAIDVTELVAAGR
jgi:hypothetical protein